MTLLIAWTSLDVTERVARCRSLSMGAKLLAGDKAAPLCAALAKAETDATALSDCDNELARLPTLQMRKLLSAFVSTLRVIT